MREVLKSSNVPYTYLIGWTRLNKWYYGVRYSKTCNPSDLWVSYFTSSKYVKQFIMEHGEPDLVTIRRRFTNPQSARKWEHTVCRRLDVAANNKWINLHNGGEKFMCNGHSQETRAKLSKASKGRVVSQASRERIGNLNRGKKLSKQTRDKLSKSRMGIPSWSKGLTGIYSDEVLEKMCREYEFTNPKGLVIKVKNLKKFCNENGLSYEGMKRVAMGKHRAHQGYRGNPPRPDIISSARSWLLYKEGLPVSLINLKQFCGENNLSYRAMKKVANGEQLSHNGYTKEPTETI